MLKRAQTGGKYKVSLGLKLVVFLCNDRTLAPGSLIRPELSSSSLGRGGGGEGEHEMSFYSGNLAWMFTNVTVLVHVSTAKTKTIHSS